MKKVNFNEGAPAAPQAFSTLQDSIINALSMLLTPFGNCIVSGMALTYDGGTQTYSFTEGVVFLNGEVLRVPAHSTTLLLGHVLCIGSESVNGANYPVAHADGDVKVMQTETIGKTVSVAAPSGSIIEFSTLPRVKNQLKSGNWITVTPAANCDFSDVVDDKSKLAYMVKGDEVILRGNIKITASLANNAYIPVCTLPVAARPVTSGNRPYNHVYNHLGQDYWLQIQSSGAVWITNRTGATQATSFILIQDVRFRIDI